MKKMFILVLILLCTACFNKGLNEYDLYENEIYSYFNDEWKETKLENNKYQYKKDNHIITIELEKNNYKKENHMYLKNNIYNELIKYASENNLKIFGNSYTINNNTVYQFNLGNDNINLKYYYIIGDYKDIVIIDSIKDEMKLEKKDDVVNQIINNFEWK